MDRIHLFHRAKSTVIAATANPHVLADLWRRPDLDVREARTTAGANSLLNEAQLVILDPADLQEVGVNLAYIQGILGHVRVPVASGATFLSEPERWLAEGRAYRGDLHSLPPRLVAFTSIASGGVGKTTLTLTLALTVARRAKLPVAVTELTHGTSGFMAVLDFAGFGALLSDAYTLATQGAEPGVWHGLTVVPMEGRQGALLSTEDYASLLDRLRQAHVLTVVDAAQPHPLWPCVLAAADQVFVVAAADRPDTVANAQLAVEEADPRVRLVVNMAGRLDRLAGRLAQPNRPLLAIPRKAAIARYADPLPALTEVIWPGVRL